MALRDFALLMLICLIWGLSNVVSKIVISMWGVPPLAFGAMRFALVVLMTFPWLRPMPKPRWRMLVVGLCMGAGSFALVFIGLQTASPSATAVVGQISVPFTTLLSVVMLGERVRWRRGLGILLTLVGALTVMWDPNGIELSSGLWFVAAGALASSLGAVTIKQMGSVEPLRFQAWVSFTSFVPLTIASAWFETGQWATAVAAGWPFVAALLFSAFLVSVVAHTSFYGLLQRYDATLLAPLTLMMPLATIVFGILITNDRFDMRMAIGSALALAGVLIVALRRNHVAPLLLLFRERV